jgi:phosphate acetyltransferase
MKPLERIISAARLDPRHIVLSEGTDPRIVAGAVRAARDGLARLTLLGKADAVAAALRRQGVDPADFEIADPGTSPRRASYAAAYHELRRSKGADAASALAAATSPLGFAALMVHLGDADGTIGGAVATTADTVRAAIQVIGRAPGAAIVSSFFLMMLCEPHHLKKGAFVFADCGLVVEPTAAELAAIATASAHSFETLTGTRAKLALLSFSTSGSARHARVDKVVAAVELARAAAPDLLIDGELQFDAAFVAAVNVAKAPGSATGGEANVFVFPNLESANIGYKIAQRIGGATAIGPVLQGLARPANDLSRGCSADDVYNMIALTVVQAAATAPAG